MHFTDITEHGFESLIVNYLLERNNYEQGLNDDYNRDYALDETRLLRFLRETQDSELERSGILDSELRKAEFFAQIQSQIYKRGIVDVLRNGLSFHCVSFVMFYLSPSENNIKARGLYEQNIFSVTRQLRYSNANKNLAVDMCIFINGLPLITIELKNSLTGQSADDAVSQYMRDRDTRELLFSFKRCMVHFAVDDSNVKFCTRLAGKESVFLPFDKGFNDGAGNPPNPEGLMTDYLWKNILTKTELTRIIENYACLVKGEQIFPRYHQLDAVNKIIADVKKNGVGHRYLIQHSAGSGKSNSIAWLAHQLAGLEADGKIIFDSVFVVTDRKLLDKQINETVKNFTQVAGTVIHAEHSRDLKKAITDGRRIIITTIEKFPYIVQEMDNAHRGRRFAVIIDEAHSGQGGRNSIEMTRTLNSDSDDEDAINFLVESRKLLKNASYFAFTATPKNKTLEIFGTPYQDSDSDSESESGIIKHRAFHVYTMKQAIQEGFILDVLQNYTPVKSFYRLIKVAEDDPKFDRKKALIELVKFVEGSKFTIEKKAALIVKHFHEQVTAKGKVGGKARAMVVTSSIHNCIEYYRSVNKSLAERKSPFKALIAFSGSNNDFGGELTSRGLNGLSDSKIPEVFRTDDKYRFLIVADMFQTGFDEPLLHTMYVDKMLSDIKAVQTLSRLNRCCPGKYDTFILDFANDSEIIRKAFSRYYRGVILSDGTDPNKLYELEQALRECGVFTVDDVNKFVKSYLEGSGREELDYILDKNAMIYRNLDTALQIKFKGSSKAFIRTYNFLGAVLTFNNPDWEKLCIFLTLLVPKLPSPKGDEFPAGLVEAVDLESYRIEAQETMSLILDDKDSNINPVPSKDIHGKDSDSKQDLLSVILSEFNNIFGNIKWNDADNVKIQILKLPEQVMKDKKYQNALQNSDEQGVRLEAERVLNKIMCSLIADNMELYRQFQENESFRNWLSDSVLKATCNNYDTRRLTS
ncbi:MAG: type I restriction endonuclease subunit R [Synergistaceae bacterium]|nr:type I restriction endonuclease subunit R [Synergistaceae bacterium]